MSKWTVGEYPMSKASICEDGTFRATADTEEQAARIAGLLEAGEADRWQPIETAPKDGTPLLGFMPKYYRGKGGISVILWLDDGWYTAWKTEPTHWRPLPAPPAIAASDAKDNVNER